jgi:diguanylate cyclase (GGDEF)-like protein
MSIGIIASLIAFIAYGGLLFLVQQKGLKNNQSHRLFFFYLLDMLFIQVSYLGISTAENASNALFWYTVNFPLSSAQVIIYFFFIRVFLGTRQSRKLVAGSVLIWLVVLGVSTFFRAHLFASIHQDPQTGMFLPEIGALAGVLSIPTAIFLGGTLFGLLKHYRDQARSQQARIQYLFLAILIIWLGMATNINTTLQPYALDVIANILSAILIAYAILRYQFLELNTVLRKGIETLISVIVFGIGDFIAVLLLAQMLKIKLKTADLLLITMVATISTMTLIPLRNRIQQYFGHTLFKTTYDGYAMIQRLSRNATSILDIDQLSRIFLSDVVETLRAQWGVLFVRQKDNSFQPIAREKVTNDFLSTLHRNHIILNWVSAKKTNNIVYAFTELPGHITLPAELGNAQLIGSELIPLKNRGELIGILWLGAKIKERPYSQDDKTNLITVANNIAATTNNALLYEEIKRANTVLGRQLEEIQKLQNDLREQALRDPLTGLFNRRYLYETFERETARADREKYAISVIMVDLDHLKEINDTYGHLAGDDVLKALGALLQHSTRQGDIACRYGGDEFLVIMPEISEKNAQNRAETLQKNIRKIIVQSGTEKISMTASIGIAFYPKHGNDLDEIMKASDNALYQSKNTGRNRITISPPKK